MIETAVFFIPLTFMTLIFIGLFIFFSFSTISKTSDLKREVSNAENRKRDRLNDVKYELKETIREEHKDLREFLLELNRINRKK